MFYGNDSNSKHKAAARIPITFNIQFAKQALNNKRRHVNCEFRLTETIAEQIQKFKNHMAAWSRTCDPNNVYSVQFFGGNSAFGNINIFMDPKPTPKGTFRVVLEM